MTDNERAFLHEVVPRDFEVTLLGGTDSKCLYAGLRKHVVAVVLAEATSDGNRLSIDIVQNHVPRFLLAEAIIAAHRHVESGAFTRPNAYPAWDLDGSLFLIAKGSAAFDFDMRRTSAAIPASLYLKDVEAYTKALTMVQEQDGLYVLPRSKSHAGKPVAAASRRLIEAIAFEKEVLGRLDAKQFGIYSAFCTWKDFVEGCERSHDFYGELLDDQLGQEIEIYAGDGYLELARKVQDQILPRRIWDGDGSIPREEAIGDLMAGMESLSGYQLAQFNLMNGMHGGGLFVPLAQILGINAWENYIEIKTAGMAPESEDEQRVRSEVAVIRMLGDLGADAE